MGPEADQGLEAVQEPFPQVPYTVVPRVLCFLRHGKDVLLLRGASDKRLWAGLYNGVGGHVERGEDPRQAARREIREETGLEVGELHLGGIVHVSLSHSPGVLIFCFTGEAPSREVHPSAEGSLEWVDPARLAALPLVEDLPPLLSRLLNAPHDAPPFFARSAYESAGRLEISWGTGNLRTGSGRSNDGHYHHAPEGRP